MRIAAILTFTCLAVPDLIMRLAIKQKFPCIRKIRYRGWGKNCYYKKKILRATSGPWQ